MSAFGIGIFHTKTEHNVGTLMRSAYCFGASFVYTIGRRYQKQSSDTVDAARHIPCYHYESFDQFKSMLPFSFRLVGVELDETAKPLTSYRHPGNCVYLLGAEDHGLPPKILDQVHELVQIPGLKHCLNVASTGSILLYDRTLKESRKPRMTEFHNQFQCEPWTE